MTTLAATFLLPLFSAVTVAFVGVLTRTSVDRLAYIGLVNLTCALAIVPALPFAPALTPDAWVLLAASTLVHGFYQWTMIRTLALGDLSLAFPIMRGLAPILIAATGVIAFNEHLSLLSWTGLTLATVTLIAFGIIGHRFRGTTTDPRVFVLAGLTAVLVAAYSTIDAAGVRAMPEGEGWGFIAWFFALGGLPMIIIALSRRSAALVPAFKTAWKPGLTAGFLSFLSYGAAMMAMGIAPVAHVSAIRETSVVFAALFGWLLLGESFGAVRIALALIIVAGLVLLKLG
jgi:drug/metabolite transporter (DMT)-like permease